MGEERKGSDSTARQGMLLQTEKAHEDDRRRPRSLARILPPLGIPLKFLNGKHQACPACGGRDRVRFDDRRGNGDYFCSHCGAGNGFDLLQKVHGWAFGETARRVDQIIGNLPTVIQPRVEPKKFDSRKALRDLWCTSQPITPGDPVSLYLASRGIETPCADALRYAPAMLTPPHAQSIPA